MLEVTQQPPRLSEAASEITQRLREGAVAILDGATGTELERRGVPMHDGAWCAMATLTHGDVLQRVHEDYIRAGADILTANTFASSRNLLGPAGLGDQVRPAILRAVEVACEARDRAAGGRPVVVAGSMSHMMPMAEGTDRRDAARQPDRSHAVAAFEEMASLLAEGGCDLILMEMMSDPKLARPAIDAAVGTGLPVWVGFSCRRDASGRLVAYTRPDLTIAEAIDAIVPSGGAAFGIMHSEINDTTEALPILRSHAGGPLMAFPECGYFEMPHWQFVDVIEPRAFAAQGRAWADAGVQVIGGCCGIGPEHIAALAAELRP